MRIAVIAALAALMGGCSVQNSIGTSLGSSSGVIGNEAGGKVPYGEGDKSPAMSATQAHCAQFGKKAQITQMIPAAVGGTIVFECHGRKV